MKKLRRTIGRKNIKDAQVNLAAAAAAVFVVDVCHVTAAVAFVVSVVSFGPPCFRLGAWYRALANAGPCVARVNSYAALSTTSTNRATKRRAQPTQPYATMMPKARQIINQPTGSSSRNIYKFRGGGIHGRDGGLFLSFCLLYLVI